ncbi:hypothetical protein FOA52_008462 [Chlamydomonas sp. UWO 241]|nr:hypothetical protein FOA52_008462 [Chlamydomonas sp. UWO 241]
MLPFVLPFVHAPFCARSLLLVHAPYTCIIGVEPRGGGVLRVLFTVASDAVADTVVRWRHELRRCVDSTAVFDVLSDREEAQHQALWPAFLAAKVAGKRAQFHRARLVVDGERVSVRNGGVVPKGSLPYSEERGGSFARGGFSGGRLTVDCPLANRNVCGGTYRVADVRSAFGRAAERLEAAAASEHPPDDYLEALFDVLRVCARARAQAQGRTRDDWFDEADPGEGWARRSHGQRRGAPRVVGFQHRDPRDSQEGPSRGRGGGEAEEGRTRQPGQDEVQTKQLSPKKALRKARRAVEFHGKKGEMGAELRRKARLARKMGEAGGAAQGAPSD